MTVRAFSLFFVWLSTAAAAQPKQSAAGPFQDGERICWVGDSITASGLYHSYIQLYYATRFPSLHLSFVNCGISGDTASGMLGRLEKDVDANHPTLVALNAGMNDVNRTLYSQTNAPTNATALQKQAIESYKKNVEKLADAFAARQLRQIYFTPTIYDEDVESTAESLRGVNGALQECSDFILQFARSKNMPAVDFWHPMEALNRERQKLDPAFTLTSKDRVHPSPAGHLVMAYLFLDQTGAPRDVWRLNVDAKTARITTQTRCQTSGLSSKPEAVTFTNLELALPFPDPEEAREALSWVPFTDRLNQQILQVTGLPPGEYSLRIDQTEAGRFNSAQWAEGVNLALLPNIPQQVTARRIATLCREYYQLGNTLRTLRRVEMKHLQGIDLSNRPAVEAELQKLIKEKQAQKNDPGANSGYYIKTARTYLQESGREPAIYDRLQALAKEMEQANQPASHTYRLTPAFGTPIYHAQSEMTGEVTDTTVLLQSRLTATPGLDAQGDLAGATGVACFEWSADPDWQNPKRSSWIVADPQTDSVIRTRLESLQPGTRYFYRLVFGPDREHTTVGPIRHFRTLDPKQPHTALSFCLGNCMNYHAFMSGQPNGDGPVTATPEDKRLGYPSFAAMRDLQPDFFIGAGDAVYYDQPTNAPATTLPEMRRKWHEQFRFPRLVSFFAETPAYWLKDDHDFRFDDADLTGPQDPSPGLGASTYREQLPVLPLLDNRSRDFRTYRVHPDLQIWFLEGRDFRSPNSHPDGPDKSIWGKEQRRWLEDTLSSSPATWKLIVTPTPMVGPDRASKKDNHTNPRGFRREAEDFFAWLKQKRIPNVLLFCGDRHWQYHSIHPSGVEEYSMGALNDENSITGIRPGDKDSTDPDGQIRQVFLNPEPTGGFLRVSLQRRGDGTPEMRIEFRDDHGWVLHREVRTPEPAPGA